MCLYIESIGTQPGEISNKLHCFLCRIRKSKTNISLMPRVLAKKGGAEEVKEQDEAKKVVGQKLSNEDFRKLYSN